MVSTTRWRPTIWARRAYAQLIDDQVMLVSGETALDVAFLMMNGSSGTGGFGKVHGARPSITSFGWAPACRAAARMKNLMLDPVWRGTNAMLISLTRGWKPLPPTIARIAEVLVSSVRIASSIPAAVSGSSSRACSASSCRLGSKVVWICNPPRYKMLARCCSSPRKAALFSR